MSHAPPTPERASFGARRRRTPATILRRTALQVAVVVLLHLGLLYGLAEGDVVASLFAAGGHSSPGSLALALLFILARFVAIVVLPGFVGYRVVMLLFSLRRARGRWSHPERG